MRRTVGIEYLCELQSRQLHACKKKAEIPLLEKRIPPPPEYDVTLSSVFRISMPNIVKCYESSVATPNLLVGWNATDCSVSEADGVAAHNTYNNIDQTGFYMHIYFFSPRANSRLRVGRTPHARIQFYKKKKTTEIKKKKKQK